MPIMSYFIINNLRLITDTGAHLKWQPFEGKERFNYNAKQYKERKKEIKDYTRVN